MAALGSLLVRDLKSKVEFEIGTGFTEQQRVELWLDRMNLRGKLVKYKSQPVGVKDKPRFPVFLGWRDRRDLS
jgi:DNA ligase-1